MTIERMQTAGKNPHKNQFNNKVPDKYVINNNIFNEKKDAMPKAYNMGL